MEKYIVKGGKKLRYGYTTGSCATAAAKAACKMLYTGKYLTEVSIDTPKGWKLKLSVEDIDMTEEFVTCAIKKDSGDDPDVTNRLLIYARVERNPGATQRVEITGGIGVGMVTKPGLSIKPGNHAINPTPLEMIEASILEVLPDGERVKVTIYVPEGEEIAKKTFNSKLGIIGGISIIGTSGIVEPMSNDAMKESIALELSLMKERGEKKVVFCPGNHGENIALEQGIKPEQIIKTSNYIGFMIEKAVEYGFESVLLIGHIGKLVKVAGGIFDTHSRVADCRVEILAANCALLGASTKLTKQIMSSITTDEATNYIFDNHLEEVFQLLTRKISSRCEDKSRGVLSFETILFSFERGILATDIKENRFGVEINV